MSKFNAYTRGQLLHALRDCHETLKVGQYEYDSPYARKLWGEIDEIRQALAGYDVERDAHDLLMQACRLPGEVKLADKVRLLSVDADEAVKSVLRQWGAL